MAKLPMQLQQVADHVHRDGKAKTVEVKELLSWFDAHRRGYLVVKQIRSALRRARLVTEPNFESAPIEGRTKLAPAPERARSALSNSARTMEAISEIPQAEISDPTPRLGTLGPANRKPLSVTRDSKVREAVTLMVQHDYSQLPVMQNSRSVDG